MTGLFLMLWVSAVLLNIDWSTLPSELSVGLPSLLGRPWKNASNTPLIGLRKIGIWTPRG